MDCDDFDALVQEMLDCRRIVPLDLAAERHRELCLECAQHYDFYCQLLKLTEDPTAPRIAWQAPHQGAAEVKLAPPTVSAGPAIRSAADVSRESQRPTVAPTGRSVRLADHRRWSLPLLALGTVAASLLAGVVAWQWPQSALDQPAAFLGGSGTERIVEGFPHASPSADGRNGVRPEEALAGRGPDFGSPELREFAKRWDDSVVAWDRGWQSMAAGRVRAHQIPGIEPAVYPITGAVEAFRKNMIIRNQNGLAAGLRW